VENTNKGSIKLPLLPFAPLPLLVFFLPATVGVFHQQSSSSPQVLFSYHLLAENTNKGSIKSPLLLFAPLPLLVFFTNSLPHHHMSCLAILCWWKTPTKAP
jgi:hypothetical protein